MSEKCPNCGAVITNPNNTFCTSCGRPFPAARTQMDAPAMETGEVTEPLGNYQAQEPVSPPVSAPPRPTPQPRQQVSLPPDAKPPKRRRSCLGCLTTGLITSLVLLIVLVGVYFALVRPQLETYVLGQINSAIESVDPGPPYDGELVRASFTEEELNDRIEIPAELADYVNEASVELEQDRVLIDFTVLGLSSQLSAGVSADENGGLYIHDVDTGWLVGLVLSGDALATELTDSINRHIVSPSEIRILAVQITDGQIVFVYEGENR